MDQLTSAYISHKLLPILRNETKTENRPAQLNGRKKKPLPSQPQIFEDLMLGAYTKITLVWSRNNAEASGKID